MKKTEAIVCIDEDNMEYVTTGDNCSLVGGDSFF
jgi:hypothetical protein